MPALPAYQRIVDDISSRIASGQLRSGDQLPTQRELATTWHCSLQPVKMALTRLELMGKVENRQGVGAFVL